jgi:hypothetical protein
MKLHPIEYRSTGRVRLSHHGLSTAPPHNKGMKSVTEGRNGNEGREHPPRTSAGISLLRDVATVKDSSQNPRVVIQ